MKGDLFAQWAMLVASIFTQFPEHVCGYDRVQRKEVHVGSCAYCDFRSMDQALTFRRNASTKRHHFFLHEGTYGPIKLDSTQDSGTHDVPIVLEGYNRDGEIPPVISGGVEIPLSAFTSIANTPLMRANLFDFVTKPQIGSMAVGSAIGDCQHKKTDIIYMGEVMTLARWPNIAKDDGSWSFANLDSVTHAENGSAVLLVNTTVQPDASRMSSWVVEDDVYLHGYWTFDWTDSYVKVAVRKNAEGEENRRYAGGESTITVDVLETQSDFKPNARFYGVNILAELDVPFEYFINKTNGTLYFYPPSPMTEGVTLTVAPVALDIGNGTSFVKIDGVVIANAQGTGIHGSDVDHVVIHNVTSINHGRVGIDIDGTNYQLLNSKVKNIGCVGIKAHGGDFENLLPGNNVISGNNVTRFATWKRTYQAGILWGGVDNNFTQNFVSDGPHNCWLGGGNEIPASGCLHQGNIVERCAYEASDTGAWYSCGQSGAWTNRGNRALNNTFRSIRCGIQGRSVEGCGGGVQAVYLDDQVSGWVFEGNVFENCDTGFFVGGGRSTIARWNTFDRCDLAVHLDNRGMGWERGQINKSLEELAEVLNGPAGNEWVSRWPELEKIVQKDHLGVPVYNQIVENRYSECGRFIDASPESTSAWLDSVSNNRNVSWRK